MKAWWRAHRPTTRRLAQLYCALLYNANLRGFAEGQIYAGPAKALCVPGLNCYSCPGAVGACPLGALQNAMAAAGTRAGTYILGILLLFGVTLGRTVCGWLCPMGLVQELLHKIPTPKLRKGRATRALSWVKYALLAVLVLAVPLWYGVKRGLPLPAFCKYVCPAGTLEGAVGLLGNPKNAGLFAMLGALFTQKFVIMLAVGLACVFCYRAFCRFLCPLGAIYGLFNRVAIVGVRADAGKCTRCGSCVRRCPMDVKCVGDRECVVCGACMDVCGPGAISIRAGKAVLRGPDLPGDAGKPARVRRGRRIWGAALAVLAVALVGFNARRAEPVAPDFSSDAPVGSAVGQQLEDFAVETLDGDAFRLSDARGNPVFINLWATYCAPCVKELPHFQRLREAHPEIAVLAVHASLVTEDVSAYLAGRGWDGLRFCVDGEDDRIFGIVGGSSLLPQTVVLNANGEVVYNQTGSVTYEQLEALLAEAGG